MLDSSLLFRPLSLVLLLIFAGLYLAWTGISDIWFTAKARSWPTVQGTIHAKDVWTRSGRHGTADYIPTLRYFYVLNGSSYTSEKIRHDSMGAASKARALQIISAYSVGMPATVHYDPKNPSNSVLEVGDFYGGTARSAIGLGFCLLGVVIGRPLWRNFDRKPYYDSSDGGW
ncbi:DUF3592 domain-containing protein [Prosthecobacter sp.]|uniref:DUF3592 domain-containing protein n=1 Tax=Prosthecobacter sp. TaxID=1965333 RepID=UPI003782F495